MAAAELEMDNSLVGIGNGGRGGRGQGPGARGARVAIGGGRVGPRGGRGRGRVRVEDNIIIAVNGLPAVDVVLNNVEMVEAVNNEDQLEDILTDDDEIFENDQVENSSEDGCGSEDCERELVLSEKDQLGRLLEIAGTSDEIEMGTRPKFNIGVRVKLNADYSGDIEGLDHVKHHGVIEGFTGRKVIVRWFINAYQVTIVQHQHKVLWALYNSEYKIDDEF